MTDFRIVEAKPWHAGQMARLLRAEHRSAIAMIGIDAHRELRARFDDSQFRRAWLIDGQLAALGGVTGTRLSSVGHIWLALAPIALRYPKAVVVEARKQIDSLMLSRRELYALLAAGDEAAQRFAVFLGFTPLGGGEYAAAETRHGRRLLHRVIADAPELRHPMGRGFAVQVSLRREAA